MGSVNKVTLVGNLGADPELRSTQSGQQVANLRIATSDSWTNKQTGNREERTEWHSVSVWGKQAELCGRYLNKGRSVYIEGRLQSREYQAQDGLNRKVWEVVANQVVFLSGKGDSPAQGANATSGAGWTQSSPQQQRQPRQEQRQQDDMGWGQYSSQSKGNDGVPF